MKKVFWILFGILFVLAGACGEGEEIMSANGNNGETKPSDEELKTELIRIKVRLGSGIESDTRLVYDDEDSKKFKLLWSENDKIRVYWQDNDNTYHSSVFTLKDGVGTSEGIFEGVAPKSLPKNADYKILYPAEKFEETYSVYEDFGSQLLFPMTGQKQIGNNNMEHLAEYNYLMGIQQTLDTVLLKQNFMALMELELILPESYDLENWGKIIGLKLTPVGGRFFVTSGTGTRYYYDSVDLTLEDISLSENGTLTAYMMTHAMELYGGNKISIKVEVITEHGYVYYCDFINQVSSIESGKLYTFREALKAYYEDYYTIDPISHTIKIISPGTQWSSRPSKAAISYAVGTENPGFLILDGASR